MMWLLGTHPLGEISQKGLVENAIRAFEGIYIFLLLRNIICHHSEIPLYFIKHVQRILIKYMC